MEQCTEPDNGKAATGPPVIAVNEVYSVRDRRMEVVTRVMARLLIGRRAFLN